jgi:hypothetical protein
MARPTKHNVTYFPHDCDMRNDVKITALRRKFGHTGYSFWNMILEFLGDCEYFEYEWSEFNKELLSADFNLDVKEINEIVEYLLYLNLIQIENNFITCDSFTKRLESEVLSRRKDYDSNNSLRKQLMLTLTPLEDNSENINGQSKVKETKENENKENQRIENESKEEDRIRNESEVDETKPKGNKNIAQRIIDTLSSYNLSESEYINAFEDLKDLGGFDGISRILQWTPEVTEKYINHINNIMNSIFNIEIMENR